MDQIDVGLGGGAGLGLWTRKWRGWEICLHCGLLTSVSPCTSEFNSKHWILLPLRQKADGLPHLMQVLRCTSDSCSPGFNYPGLHWVHDISCLHCRICYPSIPAILKARHTHHEKGRRSGIGEVNISSLSAYTLCKPRNFLKILCPRDISTKLWTKWISLGNWSENENLAGVRRFHTSKCDEIKLPCIFVLSCFCCHCLCAFKEEWYEASTDLGTKDHICSKLRVELWVLSSLMAVAVLLIRYA